MSGLRSYLVGEGRALAHWRSENLLWCCTGRTCWNSAFRNLLEVGCLGCVVLSFRTDCSFCLMLFVSCMSETATSPSLKGVALCPSSWLPLEPLWLPKPPDLFSVVEGVPRPTQCSRGSDQSQHLVSELIGNQIFGQQFVKYTNICSPVWPQSWVLHISRQGNLKLSPWHQLQKSVFQMIA